VAQLPLLPEGKNYTCAVILTAAKLTTGIKVS
jgi:hypothetical protein